MPPDVRGPEGGPLNLYTLVHSPSQPDLKHQEQIDTTIKTQFDSASWEQIRSSYKKLSERDPKRIHPIGFLILDQQSVEDRKVIILQEVELKGQWFTPEGDYADITMESRDDLVKRTVWHKYRVPFDKAFDVQSAIEGYGAVEFSEPYFEKEVMGDIPVEEEEDESEETDSDGTTSTDLEYI